MGASWEGGEGPKIPQSAPKSKEYVLQGSRISFDYQGYPILMILGGSTLELGRPRDLDDELAGKVPCGPEDLVIVQKDWMERTERTGNPRGFLVLKDGATVFIGNSMQNDVFRFDFSSGIGRMHLGITKKGDIVTIGDLNSKATGHETTIITTNLPTPNPGSPAPKIG